MYFTGKYDGPSIEEYIKDNKSLWKERWKIWYTLWFQRMMLSYGGNHLTIAR
jgi:hypothetical protein